MATMWKELESLHQRLDGSHPPPTPGSTSSVIVSLSPQSNPSQSYTNTPSTKNILNVSVTLLHMSLLFFNLFY